MFQRALPEVDGFGVITSTPGLIRSSQPVMCFGLPLRTTNTTTESLEKPLYGLASQLLDTIPSLTSRVISGVVENSTTSAGCPVSTARLCDPAAPARTRPRGRAAAPARPRRVGGAATAGDQPGDR